MNPETDRTPVFLLFGGLVLFHRHPRLLDAIAGRGLGLVLMVEPGAGGGEALERAVLDRSDRLHRTLELHVVPRAERQRMVDAAAGVAERYEVVGTFCIGEGLVDTAGLVAEVLGLPSPGLFASTVCRDKLFQRRVLSDHSPRFSLLASASREKDAAEYRAGWPAVLKPTGRFSSSGVVSLSDPGDLPALLETYPEEEQLLLEERVDGPEYSVECLVHSGTVVFQAVTGKLTNEAGSSNFVEVAHTAPATGIADRDRERLEAAARDALGELRFDTGVAHLEFRLGPRGPVLMEAAARMPGDGLAMLYTLATGASFEEAVLDLALGRCPEYPPPRRYTRQRYLWAEGGHLSGIERAPVEVTDLSGGTYWPEPGPLATGDPARVREVLVTKPPGAAVGPPLSSFDRVGSVILDAPSPEELDALDNGLELQVMTVAEPPTAGGTRREGTR